MKLSFLFASLFFVGLLPGCTRGIPTNIITPETANDQVQGRAVLGSERAVVAKNAIGSLILKWGGVEDSLRWTLSRQVTGENKADAAAFLSSIQLIRELSGDSVKFFPQSPTGISGYTFSMLITLGVPYRMACVVDGVQGSTTVADLGAPLTIRAAHGVTVQRLNASCDIASSDGGVSCQVALPPGGTCVITAVKGTITLNVPTNTSANVTARATNGSVSYSNLTFSELNQQTGLLTGKLGAANGQIQLQTGEGNIVIRGVIP